MKDRDSNQRGIALLVAFFVMGISVAIVLGVGIVLLSELKMIKGMGGSVTAFYAADTGLEKTLYYDRKVIPDGGTRGACAMPTSCNDCSFNSPPSGIDCVPETCTDCVIDYSSQFGDNKSFQAVVTVAPAGDVMKSYGSYIGVSRAMELSGSLGGTNQNNGPVIANAIAQPRSVPSGVEIVITANIFDVDGLNPSTIVATIKRTGYSNIPITMANSYGDVFFVSWVGPEGVYYVDITACDLSGNCTTETNI